MKKTKLHWFKRMQINTKARERYHMKKYGNLDKLIEKQKRFEAKLDEDSFRDEMQNVTEELDSDYDDL